ncbi:MAG TPA: glycosyltransferase family 39 protein [Ktedonobacteraceae bacterium]
MEQAQSDLVDPTDISLQPTHVFPIFREPPSRPRVLDVLRRYQGMLIGGLLFFAALGFDLYHLGTPSIWFDEAFSVELARQPLPLLWHVIFGPEPNMEFYYLILHFWLQVTGAMGMIPTEFLVRLPSAIFAALSTLVLFFLGRRFLGPWAGTVAAGLYLLNDVQLVYAQQTRAYSLQLLLLCLAWYALFAACTVETRDKRWWLWYVLFTTLALYTQLFSALVIVAQVVALIGLMLVPNAWRAQLRKRFFAFVVSLLISGILSIPMAVVSRHGSKTGWMHVPHLSTILSVFLDFSARSTIYLLLLLLLCSLGLLVALLASASPISGINRVFLVNASKSEGKRARQQLPVILACLCWLILPVILSFIISQGPTRMFSSRYLVVVVPPLCLLVGSGVATIRLRAGKLVLGLAIIALALHYTPLYYQSAQVENWSTPTFWLVQRYQPGDGLVCYTNVQGCQTSVQYYLTRYQSPATFDADSPGAFSWENDGPINPVAGNDAAVNPAALAVYGAHHPRLFFIAARLSGQADALKAQTAEKWLDSHYHLVAQIVTPAITIRLYATGAPSS